MEAARFLEPMTSEQDRQISRIFRLESGRLLAFIRRRVADEDDAEDILQEAFSELVASFRLARPIEEAGPWLFRVARNRIIDRFRKEKAHPSAGLPRGEEGAADWEEILPSGDGGPEEAYERKLLARKLAAALSELPAGQREAFVASEIEGKRFRELSEESGTSVNTLLSRKRYAVLRLRERLRDIYEDLIGG